jgi:hypothetical protein
MGRVVLSDFAADLPKIMADRVQPQQLLLKCTIQTETQTQDAKGMSPWRRKQFALALADNRASENRTNDRRPTRTVITYSSGG